MDRIGRAEELELATRKPDGSLSVFTTMWVVGVGTALDPSPRGGGRTAGKPVSADPSPHLAS